MYSKIFNFKRRERVCAIGSCNELAGSNSRYCRECNKQLGYNSTNRNIYNKYKHSKKFR